MRKFYLLLALSGMYSFAQFSPLSAGAQQGPNPGPGNGRSNGPGILGSASESPGSASKLIGSASKSSSSALPAAGGVVTQPDSNWLDAGMLKIRKDFTQAITIRGEELEKMHFTHLGVSP